VSEARVFCVEAVKPGDELEFDGRRWPVIAVSCVPGWMEPKTTGR